MTKFFSILVAVAISAMGCSHLMGARAHPDADTSRTRASRAGAFVVSYEPAVSPVPKRQLHSWTVDIRTRDGRPVEGARMTVAGGMPDHGHGLPTEPVVSAALGNGRYVVDGMKFNMGGYWIVDLGITAPEGHDDVRFELNL
ncbi:hypothetical protein BH11MYX4_BH11MYX4_28630 [soil metagenome]